MGRAPVSCPVRVISSHRSEANGFRRLCATASIPSGMSAWKGGRLRRRDEVFTGPRGTAGCRVADDVRMGLKAVLAVLASLVALAGCGGGDGAAALRRAAAKTRAAPYVVISQAGAERLGGELLLSRGLLVIRSRNHIVAWTARTYEWTWRASKRCYERHTAFNREDVRQERQGVVPSDASKVELHRRAGATVLSGRVDESTDSPATEFELTLDSVGRASVLHERSARFGAVPAGKWTTVGYRYPTAAQFARLAGPGPRPRCT